MCNSYVHGLCAGPLGMCKAMCEGMCRRRAETGELRQMRENSRTSEAQQGATGDINGQVAEAADISRQFIYFSRQFANDYLPVVTIWFTPCKQLEYDRQTISGQSADN